MDPRVEAVRLLCKFKKNGSYSALALVKELKDNCFSDRRDLSFAVALVYGVLEHRLTLDYNISLYLRSGLNKLKGEVLNILRAGCFQLLYLDRIPVSAAVNEAVKSSHALGVSFASGVINAVLRRVSENGLRLPEDDGSTAFLSVKYSVSENIVSLLYDELGSENCISVLESFSGRRPLYIRRNNLLCSEKQLISALESQGVRISGTAESDCYSLFSTGDIASLNAYKNGFFHVQDLSSQLCVRILDPQPGETVIDCCSAPGGKAFTCAERMKNSGKIYAFDVHEHKIKLIEEGAKRLGIKNITAACLDARRLPESFFGADKVLCDVPCSGFGVIGRKPEIRYASSRLFSSLPDIQSRILNSCCRAVREGGTLVYSTCTLNSAENSVVCRCFLDCHPEFHLAADAVYRSLTDSFITCLPRNDGGDGFFIAKFIRGRV